MTLLDLCQDNIDDAVERQEALDPSTREYMKQRIRAFEAGYIKTSLEAGSKDVGDFRTRLKQLYFEPENYPTLPPPAK